MKATSMTETLEIQDIMASELYEVIENEKISDCIQKDLSISGSLFTKTVFKNVTFRNCVFFSSRIMNCEFVGCKFASCEFQFSSFESCKFASCNFAGCSWATTPINKSSFKSCFLDIKTMHYIAKGINEIAECFRGDQDFGALTKEIAA